MPEDPAKKLHRHLRAGFVPGFEKVGFFLKKFDPESAKNATS